MEYIVLDIDEATEEQLIATIDCNNRTSRLMRSEIAKLKQIAETAKKKKKLPIPEFTIETTQEKSKQVDEDFENEVEYYLTLLKELTIENIEDEIETALPSVKHYQYERIINRLKLESLRTIKEITDLLAEEGLTIDDISSFQEEFNLERKKLELLTKRLLPKEQEKEEQTKKENKLIFVPNQGGTIRILDELDSIPYEYHERFLGLFQSIKDGTFKNVQRFTGNNELNGLCEVKDFKVRVLFVRLSKDAYAVISAFIKKSDNDKAYRGSVSKKYNDFQLVEDSLIRNLDNEEFLQLHRDYEQEVFRKLSPSPEKTPIVKKKVGDA